MDEREREYGSGNHNHMGAVAGVCGHSGRGGRRQLARGRQAVRKSPCRACQYEESCVRTEETCAKLRKWKREAFHAIHGLSKKKKPPPEPASDFCMRRRCQWKNPDGLCIFPCMEPDKRRLASSMQRENREICKEAHKRERQRRRAERTDAHEPKQA